MNIKYKLDDFIKLSGNKFFVFNEMVYIGKRVFIKLDLYNKIIEKLKEKNIDEFCINIDLNSRRIKINKC